MVKNQKNCLIVDVDSSKWPSWCTECNAKNHSSVQSTIFEKNKIWCPKLAKIAFLVKKVQFLAVFLDFFKNGTVHRAVVFCVAFSASRRSFWAIKINNRTIFPIFHHKGGPFWFRGGQKLHNVEKMVEKKFWKKKIWKVGPNGTRKWVVEVSSSHVVLSGALYSLLYDVLHNFVFQLIPSTKTLCRAGQR